MHNRCVLTDVVGCGIFNNGCIFITFEHPSPHYFVAEESFWLSTWFENPGVIKIPIEEFE